MITHTLKVRLYDTDAMGILYFGNQFRFVQASFETALDTLGFPIYSPHCDHPEAKQLPCRLVMRHTQANYTAPVHLNDVLQITWSVTHLGTTSFTSYYAITANDTPVGDATTTHVALDKISKAPVDLPSRLRAALEQHIIA